MQTIATKKAFVLLAQCEKWLGYLVIAILALQILILAQHTFSWRYGEDVGFFYYFSWLVNEHHYLPYRDLHETSFPGSFLLYALITRISGYSVTAYNITHMLLFAALSGASFLSLQHIHRRMAWAGTCLFGSMYFLMHRSMHMQRDFLVLLFVLLAIAVMTCRWRLTLRASLTGLLFGMASAIKPHAALAAPFVVLTGAMMHFSAMDVCNRRAAMQQCLRAALFSLTGFVCVWLVIIASMIANGSWPFFYRMFTEYMPLYQKMNGIHIALSPQQRLQNALDWLRGEMLGFLLPAVAGMVMVWQNAALNAAQKRLALMFVLLCPVFLVYVALGGKFWDYHQIPAHYFFCVTLSLCFIPFATRNWQGFTARILFLLMATLFMLPSLSPNYVLAASCLKNDPVCDSEEQAAYAIEDRLEQFLRREVRPDERVEPLATSTLGPLFPAMLRAEIQPTTPYLEGFPLYHDANDNYVQHIRSDMLARMQKNPPRFIIRPVNFFAPGGATASQFDALDHFIENRYALVDAARYPELGEKLPVMIYERKK